MLAFIAAVSFFMNGNKLYEFCSASKGDPVVAEKISECRGFVIATADTLEIAKASGMKRRMCMPDSVTQGQAVDVVTKYLRDHPENRQWSAALLTTIALDTAFPCGGAPK